MCPGLVLIWWEPRATEEHSKNSTVVVGGSLWYNVSMYINEAWLAGFLEGDGCFSTNAQQGGRYVYPKFEIHQKNLEPLEAIRDTFGLGLYQGKIGRVTAYSKKAQILFDDIAPFLSSKRIGQALDNRFIYDGRKLKHNMDWFAGYYEAEGCVYNKRNGTTDKNYVGLTISQYYADETSQFCLEAVGYGRVAGPYMANGERRAYSYNLSGQDAIKTIESIKHMLSTEKVEQLERVKRNAEIF